MKTVCPESSESKGSSTGESRRLPLRWAVIGTMAGIAGTFTGITGGYTVGITIGVTVAGFLHTVLA